MGLIDRLEKRFGWLSFPGFLRFYALLHALVFALQIFRPDLGTLLEFDKQKIFAGEVWRVVTFLFSSSGMSGVGMFAILFFYFMVMIAFMMSDALEGIWGVFRTSLFFFFGWALLVLANFVCPVVVPKSGFILYGSAFFAFATLFPRVEFRMFFIIPVQVRFLGMLQALLIALAIFGDFRLLPFFLLAYLNYILFAGIPALRGQARVVQSAQRRKVFNSKQLSGKEAFHHCVVCGRTEISDPELDFRVSENGDEFCEDHLPK